MRFPKNIVEPRWLLSFSFFAAGLFLGGLAIYLWIGSVSPLPVKIHPSLTRFKHINPLLAIDISSNRQFVQNTSLGLQLQGLIDSKKQQGEVNDAEIYFQDLETGEWIGMNDTALHAPARIPRVPIMIAYYKLAESNPSLLGQTLVFTGPDANRDELFPPETPLAAGGTYTVDDLIRRMIVNGDNNSANLLLKNIDKNSLDEIFSDLGFNFDQNKNVINLISIKTSSLFYRVLYNATYLNEENSERALALLVQADNSIGLGALLPKEADFANRYSAGVTANNNVSSYSMTDCGIAYYPNHPYLVCARVTSDRTLAAAEKMLAQIGSAVYADRSYKFKNL